MREVVAIIDATSLRTDSTDCVATCAEACKHRQIERCTRECESSCGIHKRLVRMEEKGMIERTPRSARSFIVTKDGLWNLRQMRSRPWQAREKHSWER